jgi:hypothetical protein
MQRRWSVYRAAAIAVVLGLVVVLVGDRGVTAANPQGIDPLEVLNLQVKANVILLLDSSGSMRETPSGGQGTPGEVNYPYLGGDNPDSKLFQAKQVVKALVQNNETKVNFMFGQYTQNNNNFVGLGDIGGGTGTGQARFMYTTNSVVSPSMLVTDLTVQNEPGSAAGLGFQSWQDIRAGWNQLDFAEQGNTTTTTAPSVVIGAGSNIIRWNEQISTVSAGPPQVGTYLSCTVTLPAALNGTYSTDVQLTGLAASINVYLKASYVPITGPIKTCTRIGTDVASAPVGNTPADDLALAFSAGVAPTFNKTFSISRTAGARRYQVLTKVANSAMVALGFGANNIPASAPTTGGTYNSTANWATVAVTTGATLGSTTVTGTFTVTCNVVVPPSVPHFYQTGALLALDLQNAMNGCNRSSIAPPNVYTVTYSAATGQFTFSRAGVNTFQMLWGAAAPNIAGALGFAPGSPSTGLGTSFTSNPSFQLLQRDTTNEFTDSLAGNEKFYFMNAARQWNGETLSVLADGTICDMTVGPTTNPPQFQTQQVAVCGGPTVGAPVVWRWGGGQFNGNSISCNGFQLNVQLPACYPSVGLQTTNILPFLNNEIPLNADGTITGYTESQDGSWTMLTPPVAGGNVANGSTPIANSIRDMKTVFTALWNGASAVVNGFTVVIPPSGAIKLHTNPKEQTILMFVTDGEDTCSGSGDPAALTAAQQAANLYAPLVGAVNADGTLTGASDPASSVKTYMIGFGSGVSANRLNVIAWGGTGLSSATTSGWSVIPSSATVHSVCKTCIDAQLAPNPTALGAILQSLIDQGATSGEFTAQESLTDSVFEYVDQVPTQPFPADPFDARNPNNRYNALTPIKFVSTFTLPGFQGQLKAYENVAGVAVQKWSAGDKLTLSVQNGMAACVTGGNAPAVAGECTFAQLHGNATDSSIWSAAAAIRRRIYTTSQNGYFGVTVANLQTLPPVAPFRVPLWPPVISIPPSGLFVAPASYTSQGLFDAALGLPLDTSATPAADFTTLQNSYHACVGVSLPPGCTSATPLVKMQAARREAREMILAFMAGAQVSLAAAASPKRVSAGANQFQIIYKAKSWVLADSTLATAAVVAPPLQGSPTIFPLEYTYLRDGPRDATAKNPDAASTNQITMGFGLANPDADNTTPPSGNATGALDGRAVKPVMTVVYAGANDMLHAFRAGPNCAPSTAACTETGGEELWGFVPFDQLAVLTGRVLNDPEKRDPHDYMVARGIRFNDIFVPGVWSQTLGGTTISGAGVWRKHLTFGRGIAGKFLTVLDVTAPGPFTQGALRTTGPIPFWSRGNPDTTDGTTGGPKVNAVDYNAYLKMGQTWSLPAVVWVDRTKGAVTTTTRTPLGVDFVAYVGSGYGNAGEGTTFYALDALSGDVISSVDVETAAATAGLTRSGIPYTNALVADPAAFSPARYRPGVAPHPSSAATTRVYMGDLYGRVWKFLVTNPGVAIPLADLGADQPVGTAASLLGLPPAPPPPAAPTLVKPYIFLASGNDNRANGPFKIFGFRDDGDDVTTATGGQVSANQVTSFLPAVSLYTRVYDEGAVTNGAAATPFPVFRGTAQPAAAFTNDNPLRGVVFFGGTRFNPPVSAYAPLPVSGNPASYPCRSTFDSIVYALGASTGAAAYDLNAAGDDAYQIFSNSRMTSIRTQADPNPTSGGSSVVKDEGLVTGPVSPPPKPGVPPTTINNTSNVKPAQQGGMPMPDVKFSSTACQ